MTIKESKTPAGIVAEGDHHHPEAPPAAPVIRPGRAYPRRLRSDEGNSREPVRLRLVAPASRPDAAHSNAVSPATTPSEVAPELKWVAARIGGGIRALRRMSTLDLLTAAVLVTAVYGASATAANSYHDAVRARQDPSAFVSTLSWPARITLMP